MTKYRLVIFDKINSSKKIQRLQIEIQLDKNELVSIIRSKHKEIEELNIGAYGTSIDNKNNIVETCFFDSYIKPLPELKDLWNLLATILPFMQNTNPIEVKV